MSSSIYGYYASSVGSAKNKASLGISGMVSGMDIDSVVKAMSSKTTSKISKVQQNLMRLQWKQEAYQDVGTALTDFKEKYLSDSGEFSIKRLLKNSYKIDSKGDNKGAVSASGATDILENFSILSVKSLATSATFTSSQSVTNTEIYSKGLNFSDKAETVSTLEGLSLNLKVGSESYSLKMDDTVITDTDSMLKAVNNAISKSDGLNGKITASINNGKLEFTSTDTSKNITIKSNSSAAVLKTLGFAADDKGRYKNGTTVTGTAPDFSNTTKKVSFFDTLTNGKSEIKLDLNGAKATIKFTKEMVDDIKKAGEGKDGDEKYTAMLNKFVEGVQSQLDKYYKGKVKVTPKISDINGEKSYSFGFKSSDPNSILSIAGASEGLTGKGGALGLEVGSANRLLTSKDLEDTNFKNKFDFGTDGSRTYDLNVNGVKLSIGKNKITVDGKTTEYKRGVTMNNVMNAVNASSANVNMQYLSTTDRFMIKSTVSGSAGRVEMSGSFADVLLGDGNVAWDKDAGSYKSNGSGNVGNGSTTQNGKLIEGQDAKMLVSFDGQEVVELSRSTNSFSLDGLNLSLNRTFNADADKSKYSDANAIRSEKGAITFDKTVKSDDLKKAFKQMAEDYNALIKKVSKQYTTRPDRDYQPLTADMVKDEKLSKEQADLYNDKAKEGLLFGDSILGSLMDNMSNIFTGLSSMGISMSKDYKEYGKISFDEKKLDAALSADNLKVNNLFNKEGDGVFAKLDKLMNKFVNSSLANPGLITKEAGLANSNLSQMHSNIYEQRNGLEKQLKELNRKLKISQDRYYKKFTKMEKLISQYQSQSSYLGNM